MEVAANTNEPVSYLQYLQETDLSTCLLKDHMEPGLSVAPQTEGSTMLVFDLSDQWATKKESQQLTSLSTRLTSLLFVERKFHVFGNTKEDEPHRRHPPLLTVQLRGSPTQLAATASSSAPPSLSTSWHVAPGLMLFASTSTSGLGWVGGHWDRTLLFQDALSMATKPLSSEEDKPYEGLDTMCRNTVNCKVGAWAPVDWKSLGTVVKKQSIHGYAAVNLLGATGAVHASVPLNLNQSRSFPLLTTSSYFSMNVSDTDRPPLQITLEQCNHPTRPDENVASVAFSQVLAFDRWQWNVWEGRAPYVRNTIAWTIRMESSCAVQEANGGAVEDSGSGGSTHSSPRLLRTSRVSLGAAWQLNRGLAIKAVLDPHEQRLTSAILLKRWNYPRTSLSPRFLGIGIELETGAVETNPDAYYYNHHPNQTTLELPNCLGVPKTRATLPGKPTATSNADL
jgi:hypothetical protein